MPTQPTFWPNRGGPYGLEIDLGAPSDDRAALVLRAIWEHPSLSGPYQYTDRGPANQPVWTSAWYRVQQLYYGVLQLTNQARVPCQVIVSRFKRGSVGQGPKTSDPFDSPTGSARSLLAREDEPLDVLSLWLSMEALELVYPVGGYPFGDLDAAAAWRPELDAVLINIARHLHGRCTFRRGAIGFDLCLASKSQPINTRGDGRLIEEQGALRWHPPENYAL
jgi:hypothetical protein